MHLRLNLVCEFLKNLLLLSSCRFAHIEVCRLWHTRSTLQCMVHDMENIVKLCCFCQLVLPAEEFACFASGVTILIHSVAIRHIAFASVFDELDELAILRCFNTLCKESYVIKDSHLLFWIVQYSWKTGTSIGHELVLVVILVGNKGLQSMQL